MAKKFISVSIVQVVIYLILFIILPRIQNTQPADSSGHTFSIIITSTIISLIGIVVFVDEIRYWLFGIPLLWSLIMLYHPVHAYGLGYRGGFGLTLAPPIFLGALGIAIYIFIIQCTICAGKFAIYKIFQRFSS